MIPILPFAALTDVIGPVSFEPVIRIVLAAVLGGMIGWERERHGRAAGLRTHLLLCMGCALVMMVSLYLPSRFAQHTSDGVVRADPGRIAAHVLSGLGFLGAGAIIVLGQRIRGLTTAACIWVTAAIGLAVGCGYLFAAAFTFLVAIFALHFLGRWEQRMSKKDRYIRLALHFSQRAERTSAIVDLLATHSLTVLHHTVDWDAGGTAHRLQLRYDTPVDFERTTAALVDGLGPQGLARVEWS